MIKTRRPSGQPETQTAASPPDSEPASRTDDLYTRIAQRAYELYERRGREHGHDLDDWLAAERELLSR
ncbi:MAG: DUF2934 domain-containing protein [Nitrospirota bacterium]